MREIEGLDLLDLAAVGAVALIGCVLILFAIGSLKRSLQRRSHARRAAG
ncbi:hypothetical protein ATK74_2424 [Propionicimonas paludicola]|uniref:Uncharacterized protein n=1 Tax=Propionicimonas paludicola TaxID=185243 RepID=A0A2A9CTR6_9ACTN|nr:hypothetical protein [Propionicimonas paludicola]PFG17847.1 hypothetical protein ATK74_2424 [Propionicimonas paludicola]